jgi:hypothetical protein
MDDGPKPRSILTVLPPERTSVTIKVAVESPTIIQVPVVDSVRPLDLPSSVPPKISLTPLSLHPVPHYLPSTRVLGLAAFAVLVVFSLLMALPEQRADVCLSADGRVDLCYCETLRDGLIRQPSNALSGLAFPIAGIAMLWRTPTIRPGARARFHRDKRIHVVWALTCILLGPASVAFHATFLMLPGLFDNLAMLFWMSLFTAYHTGRAFKWRGIRILSGFAGMTVLFFGAAVTTLVLAPQSNGPHLVTEVAAGAAILSPLLPWLRHGFPGWRSEIWLGASIASFALAFVTFLRSETGGPWCSPDSWLQGHAAWHVLCVVSVWLAFEHAQRTSP